MSREEAAARGAGPERWAAGGRLVPEPWPAPGRPTGVDSNSAGRWAPAEWRRKGGQPGPLELEMVKDRGAPGFERSTGRNRGEGWWPLRCGQNVILCDGAEDELLFISLEIEVGPI